MRQNYLKNALTFVKEIFTTNLYLKLFYLLIIVFLCYAPSFCQHMKITTPSKDAYELKELAQTIESEEELRYFEHKYHEMELAYRTRHNGATAIKFRLMTQSIAEEAAARRDAFRQMEDAEIKAEQLLTSTLDDMDAAWQIKISSKEAALASYTKIVDKLVATHMSMRAKLREAGIHYEKVAAAGYPEDMLNKQSAIEAEAEEIMSALAKYRNDVRHYNLAYRLKYNESFPSSILLQRYVEVFDNNYCRISKGVEYGDVEFIVELLGLAESQAEFDQVVATKQVIFDAYMAEGDAGVGNATLFEDKLKTPIEEAKASLEQSAKFEESKSKFDASAGDKDGVWERFKAKEAAAMVNVEDISFDDTSEVDYSYLDL